MITLFKYGLAYIKDNRLLVCKEENVKEYVLPGGVAENNETFEEGLSREIKEELGDSAELMPETLRKIGVFEDWAAGRENTKVVIELYSGEIEGELRPSMEIEQLIWFSLSDDRSLLSAIISNKILPALEKEGLLK